MICSRLCRLFLFLLAIFVACGAAPVAAGTIGTDVEVASSASGDQQNEAATAGAPPKAQATQQQPTQPPPQQPAPQQPTPQQPTPQQPTPQQPANPFETVPQGQEPAKKAPNPQVQEATTAPVGENIIEAVEFR